MATEKRNANARNGPRAGADVDPTKNVLDLVNAESRFQDGMRDGLEKLLLSKLAAVDRLQTFANEAETKRIDQLAALRLHYETFISEILRAQREGMARSVTAQLKQFQETFNERVSQLEKFRWESGAKASVADPAMAELIAKTMVNVRTNADRIDAMQTVTARGTGGDAARREIIAWVFGGLMLIAAIAGPVVAIIALRP